MDLNAAKYIAKGILLEYSPERQKTIEGYMTRFEGILREGKADVGSGNF